VLGVVRVEAKPTVSIVGFGKPIITGTERVQLVQIATAAQWCDFYGAEIDADGIAILYKAVDKDFRSGRGFAYVPGSTPAAPDWDGGKAECGGGLHFTAHPSAAQAFFLEATRFVACPVRLDDIVVHEDAQYPSKVKAPRICAPIYEVDRYGKPVAAAGAEATA
jgi:hypothetical protein